MSINPGRVPKKKPASEVFDPTFTPPALTVDTAFFRRGAEDMFSLATQEALATCEETHSGMPDGFAADRAQGGDDCIQIGKHAGFNTA